MAGTVMVQMPCRSTQGALSLEQVNPGSIWHVDEQPSPLRRLPSSHCSPAPSKMPSPQVDVQGAPGGRVGSAWQVSEQPSKGSVFPSSQLSAPCVFPSPQVVGVHTL